MEVDGYVERGFGQGDEGVLKEKVGWIEYIIVVVTRDRFFSTYAWDKDKNCFGVEIIGNI